MGEVIVTIALTNQAESSVQALVDSIKNKLAGVTGASVNGAVYREKYTPSP